MLYKTFNSIKESFGQDYFTQRIDDEEYGLKEKDKKLNREFYGC